MFKPKSGLMAAIFTILFFPTTIFATDISSPQVGDINLGSSSSAILNLNNGGILDGNLTMGNSSQITNFNGGILNGTINGAGKVNIATDVILNGNIGNSAAISSLTINAGKTLDLAFNNNSILASGSLNIGNGATLLVGTGTISASIQAANKGFGIVKFNANNVLGGSLGTSTTTLGLVEIAQGVTLNTNSRNIDANLITIANDAIFSYGNGTIVAAIEGKNVGVGNFVFNSTKTSNFNIGQVNQLANINIVDAATVTLGGNIAATNINIGGGISGRLKSNGKNISADNINIAKGATLEIAVGSAINGAINGNSDGNGVVQFSGNGLINLDNSLGLTNKLAQILVSNQTTLDVNNIALNADDITIGEGASGPIGLAVLNQNNGTVGVDDDSKIRLNSDAILNYNGGIILGTIHGTSSNKGTFNINNDYTNNFEIGKSFDLANLNIASDKTLNANANISANNINVSGTLNLSSSAKIITGNLATSGGEAIIDLGNFGHNISGNLATNSGDILKINALNNSNIGNLKVAGSSDIADGTSLQIAFNSNDGYLSDNTKFAIISAGSGNINQIADSNINVNNSSLNQAGLLTFHTVKSGNNLLLVVDRQAAETFTNNGYAAKIYDNIDQVGANAFGQLRNLQKLIDNVATSNEQRAEVLKAIIPQNNQDLNQSAFNAANMALNITNSRLQNILFNPQQQNYNFVDKNNLINQGIFDDEVFDNQAIWLQGFTSDAVQENVGDAFGYNYASKGLIVGVDQEVDHNLRLGIAASFVQGNVKSKSFNQKETDINSYQINLYSGYNFAPYFVSGVLGVAVNQYSSTRAIPQMGLQAKAKYGGETYIAKFETGVVQKLITNLIITPKLSLTASRNQIDSYAESNADTLNLNISNHHNDILEGRAGAELIYNNWQIATVQIKPKIKLSYGYDFLSSNQSATNNFQGQSSSFQIENSNIDQSSFRYGLGVDLYEAAGILLAFDYDMEIKNSYKSTMGSFYFRYNF